jgi:stage II sporulation protein D
MAVRDLAGQSLGEAGATVVRVGQKDAQVEVRGRLAAGVRLVPMLGSGLRMGAREYAGILEIVPQPDGLVVINELPLDDYLAGVLKAEVGDQAPPAMLRAQAIVARTYGVYHRELFAGRLYHLAASTAHQQYAGRVPPDSPAWVAVRDTAGQILLWEGELFPAFYHTDSGGHTEDPRVVFGTAGMPALPPVRVEIATASPHQEWRLEIALQQLGALLARQGQPIGRITAIDVLERSVSQRVTQLAVRGTAATVTLRGHDFRRIIGYDTLKSTLFTVAVSGSAARFSGRGYGHGVGLDQWAARAMAEQGASAHDILRFYYRGAVLSSLERRATLR